jgi:hypothetical protein
MKFRFFFLVTMLCVFSNVRAGVPDWRALTIPTGVLTNQKAPYFLNANVGFVFSPGLLFYGSMSQSRLPANLLRTNDGGQTWTHIPFFETLGCGFTQIYFVNLAHGFISAYAFNTTDPNLATGGIYETVDSGFTWKRITPKGLSFRSVYAVENEFSATCRIFGVTYDAAVYRTGSLYASNDGGSAWNTVPAPTGIDMSGAPYYFHVTGNRDGIVTVVGRDAISTAYLQYSTDAGDTWKTSRLELSYAYDMMGIFSFAHGTDILRESVPFVDRQADTYSFMRSLNLFTSFDTSLLHKEMGGWIFGTSCVQYICSASSSNPGLGFLRSKDRGTSWALVGGINFIELDDQDFQNVSVVGYGAIVYACDVQRRVQKSSTGGDGTLSAAALAPKILIGHSIDKGDSTTMPLQQCDSASLRFAYQNLACSFTHLSSLRIDGLDPAEYSVSHIWKHPNYSLPDTTIVAIMPSRSGSRALTVHAQFTDDEYQTIDTSFSFTLNVSPIAGVQMGMYLKPASLTAKAGEDIQIPLYVNTSGPFVLAPSVIGLTYAMNTEMFSELTFVPAIAAITCSGVTITPKQFALTITSSTNLNLNGESLLGWLHAKVVLTDSSRTNVTLPDVTIGSSNAHCLLQLLAQDTVSISRIPECGDTTLLRFMHGIPPNSIVSVQPNPATTILHAVLQNNTNELSAYELFDQLGVVRLRGATKGDTFELGLEAVPNGTYYLRVTSPLGVPRSVRVVVTR